MSDRPKFMIAENPMAEPDGLYIFHTQIPRFLAKLNNDDNRQTFDVVDEIDSFTDWCKGDAMRIAKLMRRMGDWYIAYCTWEDNQNLI